MIGRYLNRGMCQLERVATHGVQSEVAQRVAWGSNQTRLDKGVRVDLFKNLIGGCSRRCLTPDEPSMAHQAIFKSNVTDLPLR